MLDAVKIGKRISVSRQDKGMTQEELAMRLGITPQAVSRWERGNSLPDIEFLRPLSNLFEIPLDDLLTGDITGKESICESKAGDVKQVSVLDLLSVDEIRVHFAFNLIPLVDVAQGGDLLERVVSIRKNIATEYGLVMPTVRLRDDTGLAENEYEISIREKVKATGKVYPGMSYIIPGLHGINEDLSDIVIEDPICGQKGVWVSAEKINPEYQEKFISCNSFIAAHLQHVVQQNLCTFISREAAKMLADTAAIKYPLTVEEAVPGRISYGRLSKLLIGILNEGKSVRDMYTILNFVCNANQVDDMNTLAKQVAQVL